MEGQKESMSAGLEAAADFSAWASAPRDRYYQENIAGAEWVAVSNQFFTTLMAPLTAKATGVWGRRFDIERLAGPKAALASRERLGMPGFQLQPGQTLQRAF